jgi:ABC-2 type transport system ATP-binding protein
MLEVQSLSKTYGEVAAVKEVSFSAKKGEIVGFLGPNGAGKTTTLRMLTTYMPPSRGTAKVAGYDIITESDAVRRSIGYLPENPPLYGEMTVEEYLHFVAQIKGISRSAIRQSVQVALEKCFLTDVRKKLCSHLSRGYRQRVGLGQALIHDPQVVVLDEPTSGLDPRQIIDIRKLIGSLAGSHTVILSTHILPEVSMVCSKVVIVNRGRTVLEGTVEGVTKGTSLEQVFLDCISSSEEELKVAAHIAAA